MNRGGRAKKINVVQHAQEHNYLATVLPFKTVGSALDFVKQDCPAEILKESRKIGVIHVGVLPGTEFGLTGFVNMLVFPFSEAQSS